MEIIRGIKPKPLKCVVYGPEGVGKSTFAAQAPNPLFIDTEGGTDRLDVARLSVPSSLSMLMEQLQWVKNNVGCCQTLVLDTADWAERLCIESVCQAYQKKGIEDFAYGKGYIYAYEAFGKILNMLDEILAQGVHIIVNFLRGFCQPFFRSKAYTQVLIVIITNKAVGFPIVNAGHIAVHCTVYNTFIGVIPHPPVRWIHMQTQEDPGIWIGIQHTG